MAGHNSDGEAAGQRARMSGSGIPVVLLIALVIALLALLGIGTRYYVHGDVNAIHCLLIVFF